MTKKIAHPVLPAFRRSRCAQAMFVALSAISVSAAAQEAGVQRVEITGSSIKRIEGETALPVQVITRADIEKSGVSTAAELMKTISANTAPLSDGASITADTGGQKGFNGANLRGIGVSSTLVLLNGRRLANFATPGDSTGVDLNNIPAGAIQRVEVLKDGASAIYGTDAIGGVINFITRKDYSGIDLAFSLADTDEGGADKKTVTVSVGHGDLQTDKFNFFGTLDLQQLGSLRSVDRQFIRDRPSAILQPFAMSSRTFPANIRVSSGQRNRLIADKVIPTTSERTLNPSAPACNPPDSLSVPNGPGGTLGCSYDYMRDTEIYPESDKLGFLGRATFKASTNSDVYVEYMKASAETRYRLAAKNETFTVPVTILPEPYRASLVGLNPAGSVDLRLRTTEAGGRTHEVTSDGQRLVVGLNGTVGRWEYDAAYSRAENKVTDQYVSGYSLYSQFRAGIVSGTINAFGPSTQAGKDLINSLRVNDAARASKGITDSIDAKMSGVLGKLDGGEIGLALGGEFRKETSKFNPSPLLLSNNIMGDCDSPCGVLTTGGVTDLSASSNSRNVRSVYSELNLPFTRELEIQLAVRHDRYSDDGVGGSTNPKVGVRWQPLKSVLVRGSANTGFRAPSLNDLYGQETYGSTSSLITDPFCVSNGLDDIVNCTDTWSVTRRSNKNLKPEKSRQYSLGLVVEPVKGVSASVDYWSINVRDIISTQGEQVIIQNNSAKITRDADGFISNILLEKENQGELRTSGIDLGLDWKGVQTSFGRFGVSLNGTYIFDYKRQFGDGQPFQNNVGRFLNDQVVQRWRHRLSLGWDSGPANLTLSNQYSSSYEDQNISFDPNTLELFPARRVSAYSLWDLTGKYSVSKNLSIGGGILNLIDSAPPFSNQVYHWLSLYDPTYADPRGRSYYMNLQYKFK